MCDIGQEISNFGGSVGLDNPGKTLSKFGSAAQSIVSGVNKTVDNIIRNPLPTIEVAVLIALDIPPPIASAAVSAANGGDLRQIALNAATAYAAQQIGDVASDQYSPIENATLKQLGPQYADEALIKQIVASSSGTAALTALKGGNFQQVLNAGVSGAVDSYIADTLKSSGLNKVDSKILASASSAATKAILNGQDPSTAIGNSIAATTLGATISGNVDQINKNNEIGQSLYDKYTTLKQQATDYFTNQLAPVQTIEKQNYDNYLQARNTYTDLKSKFDEQYKIYNDNKDSNIDVANKAADSANALAPKLQTASDTLQKVSDTFTASSTDAQKLRDVYANTYANPISDINKKIEDINTSNTQLATNLGPTVTKYEQQAATDQSDLVKTIGTSALDNYAKESGFVDAADQQNALKVGIDNSQDWQKYKIAQETAQWNADRSAKSYGFQSATDQKTASIAGFTDANQWSQYQNLSDSAKQNYDTQVKNGMPTDKALEASVSLDELQNKDNTPEIVITAKKDPYIGDIQYDASGNPIKSSTATPAKTTTPSTSTTNIPLVTSTSNKTTVPAVMAPLAMTGVADPKLDTSTQYLGPSVNNLGQNTSHLGKLIQLSDNPEEEQKTADTSNLVDPMTYNPDLYKTKLLASGGSTSNLAPLTSYDSFLTNTTPNMLPPAPVTNQPSRLGTLKYLYSGLGSKQPHMASGGLPHKYAEAAPEGHNPEFITGVTGYYAGGRGTGQSDDIPAMLHDGDYVMDADVVAALGDGSSKAGNEALMKFMHQVPHKKENSGQPVPAKIADGEVVLPASFVTALGKGDNKYGAKILDGLREKLREHKRAAPTSKIPPKAKSPLDYLKMVKG